MLILNKDERKIEISAGCVESECADDKDRTLSYIINTPKIICNSKRDANNIQEKLNDYAIKLCRKIINEEGLDNE